jgi:phage terminase small subunit
MTTKSRRPLSEKQQLFVLAYVETGNASEAYRRAYNCAEGRSATSIGVAAHRLLKNPKIASQVQTKDKAKQAKVEEAKAAGNISPLVDQVREAHARRHEITIDDLIAEFDELRLLAIKNGQTSAAVAATAEKRRLLFGDRCKVELSGANGGPVQVEATAAIAALIEAMPELMSGKVVNALPVPAELDLASHSEGERS